MHFAEKSNLSPAKVTSSSTSFNSSSLDIDLSLEKRFWPTAALPRWPDGAAVCSDCSEQSLLDLSPLTTPKREVEDTFYSWPSPHGLTS